MNYTQNEKIEQVTDSTIVVGVDIGSQIHYARAFDNRGREPVLVHRKQKLSLPKLIVHWLQRQSLKQTATGQLTTSQN